MAFLILAFNISDNLALGALIRSRDIRDFECTGTSASSVHFVMKFRVKIFDILLRIVFKFVSNINPFMTQAVVICGAYQWTGFYMITASVMKGLSEFNPINCTANQLTGFYMRATLTINGLSELIGFYSIFWWFKREQKLIRLN